MGLRRINTEEKKEDNSISFRLSNLPSSNGQGFNKDCIRKSLENRTGSRLENHRLHSSKHGGTIHDPTGVQPGRFNPKRHKPSKIRPGNGLKKVCRYFRKGYCKHGDKCGYFHTIISGNGNVNELEMEIVEILNLRRGVPVSIAALPMIYYGKAGFSLTKLLANLSCICVLDRPHGQHSVILAEDAPNYMEFSDHGARQIYLTFPAQSTFTELDVSNYFSKYGPVEDVRIPYQHSRTYGFVTFVYVETVKQILSTTSTHFICCDAQVLVKPYKEKSKLPDRKNLERFQVKEHSEQFLYKNTSHLPYLGFSTNKLLAHSSGNSEMEFSSSIEQLPDFVDSWTNHHDNSTQGLNLPDSPFASPIRG